MEVTRIGVGSGYDEFRADFYTISPFSLEFKFPPFDFSIFINERRVKKLPKKSESFIVGFPDFVVLNFRLNKLQLIVVKRITHRRKGFAREKLLADC